MNTTNFDRVSPDALDAFQRIVRDLHSSFTTRAAQGAHEALLAARGRHAGAGARFAAANERTSDALRAREEAKMRARIKGGAPDDLEPLEEAHRRAVESEDAARAEVEAAANALAAATTVFNKMVVRLFEGHQRGEVFRFRKTNVRKGEPSVALKAVMADERTNGRETEPVRSGIPPNSVFEEQIADHLDHLGQRADAFKLSYADGLARWTHPERLVDGKSDPDGHYRTERDLLPLIVALNRDEIQRKLFERIERDHANDSTLRLTAEEKHDRLTKLRAELLELQYEEAALRVILAGDSPEIVFRPEMHPLATLGLEVVTSAPAKVLKKATDALAHIGIEL